MRTAGKISALSTCRKVKSVLQEHSCHSGPQWVRPLQPSRTRTRGRRGVPAQGEAGARKPRRVGGAAFLSAGFTRRKALALGAMETPARLTSQEWKAGNGSLYLSPSSSCSLPAQKTKWAPHGFPPSASPSGPSSEKGGLEGNEGVGWGREASRREALWGWGRRRGPQPWPRPMRRPGARQGAS